MSNNELTLISLDIPNLINKARTFPAEGILSQSSDGLIYLDISDNYIHDLYPLLQEYCDSITKPDYFSIKSAGAHISVIYPEEAISINSEELGKLYPFSVLQAFAANLGVKRYYVLTINSPELINLRRRYNLGPQLSFKNHWIDLHITIGTELL